MEKAAGESLNRLIAAEGAKARLEGELSRFAESHDEKSKHAQDLEQKLAVLASEIGDARVEAERATTTLAQERRAHEEKLEELRNVRAQIEKDLQILSNKTLDSTSQAFLDRATKIFDQRQKESQASLETLVNPISDSLRQYQDKLQELESGRKRDEGQLVEQLRQVADSHAKLQTSTSQLVNALRSAPNTRGRWGEQQLLRILELAGMMKHVDYDANKTIDADDKSMRPDVVIKMPKGRCLVVDAKAPMAAYLAALDAPNDDAREVALKGHARQLRDHAMLLGSKNYSDALEQAPDFVVMFIPGDNLYAAAIERDPDLFEDAYNKNVIVVTPTTLLALAKAIAYGWRQERAAEDTQQTIALGLELYKRMSALGARLTSLTKALNGTVARHNELIGTLEGSVLPQARKLAQLPGASTYEQIGELGLIETSVREAREDRDLKVADEPSDEGG